MAQKMASQTKADTPKARQRPINRHGSRRRFGVFTLSWTRNSFTEPRLTRASPGFVEGSIPPIGEKHKRYPHTYR